MAFIFDYISANNPESFKEFLEKENVKKLFVFGSSLSSENPNDIDLLIESDYTDPIKIGESLINLWDFFEEYFGKRVDLMTPNSLKNPILIDEIAKTKKLIYAKEKQSSLLI